ncbi:unnamed protein product [Closterium sp. NIES-53]
MLRPLQPARRPLQPARRPLRPARRPLQPAHRPLETRSPPLCMPALLLAPPSFCVPCYWPPRRALLCPACFDTWLDDLQLYLLSDSRDSFRCLTTCLEPLSPLPPQLTVRLTHKTAKALYDAVVARYSSLATTALGRLLLPYLFPELSAFATVEDLITHLCTSDARYHAALPAEFLDRNPPSIRSGAVNRGGSGGGQQQQQQRQSETPSPQKLREWFSQREASGGSVSCPYIIRTGDRAGQTCGKPHTQHRCFSRLDNAWRAEFGNEAERPRWAELLRSGVDIFDMDYDAILAAMYALFVSAEGDCYLCVPPDPGIEAAALGASESALSGTAPAEALHTFTLDSGGSRCFFRDNTNLTPLSPPVRVRLADPSGGPVVARFSTVLPCSAVVSGSLSGLHLPSFSTNLVSTAALQDAMVTTTTPGASSGSCVCLGVRIGSGSTPLLVSPPVTPDSFGTTALVTPPCHAFVACTPTSLPLVSLGLCLPSCPRLPRPTFLASMGDSAPLLTPPRFPRRLLPCRLSTWTFCLQLCERFRQDLPVLRLHSDRGGEFSSDLLRDFCRGEGILQLFTLPASLQKNRVSERRIGLVMEVARTSMIHAAAPHFLWPFAVRYAAHQLNLWPRVSLPETLPTLCRCSGSRALMPLFAIRPQTSSPPALFPASSLAFLLTRLADSFTTPPRAVSSLFRTSRLTSRFPFTVSSPTALPLARPRRSSLFPVDPLRGIAPVEVAVGLGAARGAVSGGVVSGAAEPGGAEFEGAGSGGAELGAAETGGVGVAGAGDPTEPGAVGAGGFGTGGARAGGAGAGGTALGALELEELELEAMARKALELQELELLTLELEVLEAVCGYDPSPLPAPSPYTEQSGDLTERCEPASRLVSPVRTAPHVPRSRPPPVPSTHAMALRPSSVPLRVPLPAPPESSLREVPDPESDSARAVSPIVARLLATVVIDPSFESAAASALVAELLEFAAACCLDYAIALVAESESASPPFVGGECALGTDVLEYRHPDPALLRRGTVALKFPNSHRAPVARDGFCPPPPRARVGSCPSPAPSERRFLPAARPERASDSSLHAQRALLPRALCALLPSAASTPPTAPFSPPSPCCMCSSFGGGQGSEGEVAPTALACLLSLTAAPAAVGGSVKRLGGSKIEVQLHHQLPPPLIINPVPRCSHASCSHAAPCLVLPCCPMPQYSCAALCPGPLVRPRASGFPCCPVPPCSRAALCPVFPCYLCFPCCPASRASHAAPCPGAPMLPSVLCFRTPVLP